MSEEATKEKTAAANPQVRNEARDVKFCPVVFAALGLLVLLVIIHFALAGLWDVFSSETKTDARRAQGVLPAPPQPRLQTASAQDETALRSEQESHLNSYGWVDRKKGVSHIPIERAMELSAKP